jgi:hypothetical protein
LSSGATGDTRRRRRAALAGGGLVPGLWLALAAAPVAAQVNVIAPQSLFFDQASLARRNYMEVDAGAIYTDNVYLQPSGPGDTLGMLGLVGDLERTGTRFDYRVDSDMAVAKYLHSDFGTQPFGFFNGTAELKLWPSFFSWTAQDTLNNLVINPLAPVTPDNLETINVVTTGPRFTLTPTLRTSVVVDGFYSFVDSNSNSPLYVNINNRRYGGDLTTTRAFTSTTSAYITGTVQKVEYSDTAENTDFRSDSVNGGIKFVDPRTLVDISGGYERLHTSVVTLVPSDVGIIERPENQTPSGANWLANLSRVISPTQRVSLYAQRLITDSATLFGLGLNQAVPNLNGNLLATGQPFTYTIYGASWRFEMNRTTFQVNLSELREEYEYTTGSNATFKFGGAEFTRSLTPTLKWDIGATYGNNAYGVSTNHILTAVSSLRWSVGRRLGLRFIYAYSNQSNPGGYSNNQVGLIASYALTPVGGAPSQPEPTGPSFLSPVAPQSSQPWQPPVQQPSTPL